MSRVQLVHYAFDNKADLLNEGSYAEIYRAYDTKHKRHVALKILRPRLEVDPYAYERFEREAQYMAALQHPSIPLFYEYGTHQHTRYFTMEYILGTTLLELAQHTSFTIDDGIHVATQLAETLAFLHGKGFLHRDVKPGNVMVLRNKSIKLLDFGIAFREGDKPLEDERVVAFSVRWAAPEVISRERIDKQSEVFSYGGVLYYVFTGRVPFPGNSFPEVYINILDGKLQRPSKLRNDLPARLDDFIMRCMHLTPSMRYSDGIEVQRALEDICHDLGRR